MDDHKRNESKRKKVTQKIYKNGKYYTVDEAVLNKKNRKQKDKKIQNKDKL